MRKYIITMLVISSLEGRFDYFIKSALGASFLRANNDYFKKNAYNYLTQFRYRKSVGFPVLILDAGFKSSKSFKFLRHSNNFIWGMKSHLSNTSKKVVGEIGFDDTTSPAFYFASHEFNIRSFCPYAGVIFNGKKTQVGITGGVHIMPSLFKKLSIYENNTEQPYTGLHLNALDPALAATLTIFAEKKWLEGVTIQLGYEFTHGTQTYKPRLHIERAHSNAQDFLQPLHLLPGLHEYHMEFQQIPVVTFTIHTLSLCVGYEI